ncbi:hypothetical protein [Thalassotalea euphylliae]|uniref:hypothetical protein n=1 Tax=Thalassotalea euphylliae TaxID=1655234 RepID=UPI0015F29108|nr:hypothetical protein [Thalassotalea euphylliae]
MKVRNLLSASLLYPALYLAVYLTLYIVPLGAFAKGAPFVEQLAMFEPYLGTWEAVFEEENGKPTVVDVSHWEKALNGTTLRTLHSINDGMYGGESLIFFDKTKRQLVFYYFTTAGFYTQGTIEVLSDNRFVAYEAVTGNKDGITQVKSTSTMSPEKLTVSTSYLKKGQWTEPERRTYQRSNKKVKFK